MKKQNTPLFRGAATALITPFCEGRIDFDALGRLIERQIEGGIDALVLVGTTGESATLTDAEKMALFAFAAERIGGRVPLIAGTGCADTAHTIALCRSATVAGVDGFLIVTPYYNKPSQNGLRAHFERVADALEKPIILYSVPGRTGVIVATDTYIALSKHPNIVAVKEANTDIAAITALIDSCGEELEIYAGNDDMTVPMLTLGGAGVISVLSNILPCAVHDIPRLWWEGKPRLASAKSAKYRALCRALFSDTNPVPVKYALSLMGLCREDVRLPLVSPSDSVKDQLKKCLTDLKLIEP